MVGPVCAPARRGRLRAVTLGRLHFVAGGRCPTPFAPACPTFGELRQRFLRISTASHKQLKRGPKEKIFASEPAVYDAAEGEMLEKLADDPEQFLHACWRYYA